MGLRWGVGVGFGIHKDIFFYFLNDDIALVRIRNTCKFRFCNVKKKGLRVFQDFFKVILWGQVHGGIKVEARVDVRVDIDWHAARVI